MQAAVQDTGTLSAMQKTTVRSTMRQLAQAIAYTHQHGVTHRDIKPENVLLQDNGNIALCDFGISNDIINGAYESTVHLAAPAGTIAYCAPEAGSHSCRGSAEGHSLFKEQEHDMSRLICMKSL